MFFAKEGANINPKIQKIETELEKNRSKISELQTRNKEMERQKTELENAEIIALVRGIQGVKGTPEDLSALLESLRAGSQAPAASPAPEPEPVVNTGHIHGTEQEDNNEV